MYASTVAVGCGELLPQSADYPQEAPFGGRIEAAIQRPANSDYCRIESLEGCVELCGLAVRECICGLKSPQPALIFLDASALVHADASPKMTERVLGVVLRRGRQTIYRDF
jgi:hypothetical protein